MMTRKPFTLVEILVSMIVLSVFLLGLLQFHNMTQSTMSLAADRTDLFERARIAMDMMANDISCAYYSGNEKSGSKPWECTGTAFKVATMRSDKVNESQVSPVLTVLYEYNAGEHALYYSSEVNTSKTELIDGVTDFEVKDQMSGSYPLPHIVTITMELVDRSTIRRMKNSNGANNILEAAPKRQFRRMVVIDRGQPES